MLKEVPLMDITRKKPQAWWWVVDALTRKWKERGSALYEERPVDKAIIFLLEQFRKLLTRRSKRPKNPLLW